MSHYFTLPNGTVPKLLKAGLTLSEVCVTIMLFDHRNGQTGRCFPSIEMLATETKLGPSTIKRALSKLRALGLIRVSRKGNGPGFPNFYDLAPLEAFLNAEGLAVAKSPGVVQGPKAQVTTPSPIVPVLPEGIKAVPIPTPVVYLPESQPIGESIWAPGELERLREAEAERDALRERQYSTEESEAEIRRLKALIAEADPEEAAREAEQWARASELRREVA